MVWLPPVRFSITTGWPRILLISWPSRRGRKSVTPPGGLGEMNRMGFCGNSPAMALIGQPRAGRAAAPRTFSACLRFMSPPVVIDIGSGAGRFGGSTRA
ncbi:Uncharacterised protein [Bordetella pertussis]|nr:Uncharacterised protein [Bordetella pertussis]CFP65377.1 Uncharacterised protein [Bordetella pertussis]CFW40653.1 Uncharacterised protein [Bordetella pertussis]